MRGRPTFSSRFHGPRPTAVSIAGNSSMMSRSEAHAVSLCMVFRARSSVPDRSALCLFACSCKKVESMSS